MANRHDQGLQGGDSTHPDQQWFNRFPSQIQIYVVIGGLLPTLLMFGARDAVQQAVGWVAFVALYGVYLLAVIVVTARSQARRNWALLVAGAVLAIDLAQTWYATSPDTPKMTPAAFIVFRWSLTVGYVAAWGIARRLDARWLVGLPLAAIAVIALLVPLDLFTTYANWFQNWSVWIGVFVVGCLICWLLDASGRGLLEGAGPQA